MKNNKKKLFELTSDNKSSGDRRSGRLAVPDDVVKEQGEEIRGGRSRRRKERMGKGEEIKTEGKERKKYLI